jgi:ribosome modulation factor
VIKYPLFWIVLVAVLCVAGASVGTYYEAQSQKQSLGTAYEEGKRSGLIGQPPTCCPYPETHYHSGRLREEWMRGWSDGDMDRRKEIVP